MRDLLQDGLGALGNHASPDPATALQHANNDCLTFELSGARKSLCALLGMHVLDLATDKCLVHFHDSRHRLRVILLHRKANPLEHEPCGLLGYAEARWIS